MHVSPLVGKQRESVRLATARLNVWEGSVRSSKTVSSLVAWIAYVRAAPAGNLLMVGKTERTLKRNIIDPLVEILGAKRCRLVAGTGELWLLGRRVYVAGANDERAQEKIRGLTLLAAYVDEASTVPESFWIMLLTRLSERDARLFATTNPDNPTHWLKRGYLDRAAVHLDRAGHLTHHTGDTLDLARFSFTLDDNPHLPAAYVDSLRREFTGLWYRRLILGEWVVAEGAIYDMWDEPKHLVDVIPEITRWIGLGVDYGTTNPFAALALGLGVDGRLYLAREWRWDSRARRRQLTDAEYSQRLRDWLDADPPAGSGPARIRPEWTVVDPSATSFVTQLFRDGATPKLADNSVLDGIRLVASLLSAGRLLVHRSCRGWAEEIGGYSWDDKAAAKGEDKPIKVADHSLDAGRYVIRTTQALWRPYVQEAAA